MFYPDCKFSTTAVTGKVDDVELKATGKEILEQGWRMLYSKDANNTNNDEDNPNPAAEESTLPTFTKGEKGPHTPTLSEKWTVPPKFYTEATLLRAMETAGKFVDDEELRSALKENGIGRPSSRAGIIETLFKRHYIRRERKNLLPTKTGIELIGIIREELLKSCELTGIWEKKLRDIEHGKYDAQQFVNELKVQITEIVNEVLGDNSHRQITITTEDDLKKTIVKKKTTTPKTKSPAATKKQSEPQSQPLQALPANDSIVGTLCPQCQQGQIVKGKGAYGCSNWKAGCKFRLPFGDA